MNSNIIKEGMQKLALEKGFKILEITINGSSVYIEIESDRLVETQEKWLIGRESSIYSMQRHYSYEPDYLKGWKKRLYSKILNKELEYPVTIDSFAMAKEFDPDIILRQELHYSLKEVSISEFKSSLFKKDLEGCIKIGNISEILQKWNNGDVPDSLIRKECQRKTVEDGLLPEGIYDIYPVHPFYIEDSMEQLYLDSFQKAVNIAGYWIETGWKRGEQITILKEKNEKINRFSLEDIVTIRESLKKVIKISEIVSRFYPELKEGMLHQYSSICPNVMVYTSISSDDKIFDIIQNEEKIREIQRTHSSGISKIIKYLIHISIIYSLLKKETDIWEDLEKIRDFNIFSDKIKLEFFEALSDGKFDDEVEKIYALGALERILM